MSATGYSRALGSPGLFSNRILFRVCFVLVLIVCLAGCADEQEAADPGSERGDLARKLNSLGYAATHKVRPENRGLRSVVHHDPDRAFQGLNLYGSLSRREAYLRSMAGDLVHTWTAEGVFTDRADFPLSERALTRTDGPSAPGLDVAEIHAGHLLAIEPLSGLVKLDWNSRVVFALANNAHHDVDTGPDGSIHVLTAAPRRVDTGQGEVIIIDDLIERISPDGELLDSYSIFELLAEDEGLRPLVADNLQSARYWFRNLDGWEEAKIAGKESARAEYEAMFDLYRQVFVAGTRSLKRTHELYVLYVTPADILHCNSLEVLAGRPDGLWGPGHVMVSVRNLDLIVVFDLSRREVVWAWGPGRISRQHQPSALAGGDILLFDNGTELGRSAVLEVDPRTGQTVWTFGDTPESRFFCAAMGGAQRLPNGNTLITDSAMGRAYEVTPDGGVVWDFFNPDHGYNPFESGSSEETIGAIYRMVRVRESALEGMAGR